MRVGLISCKNDYRIPYSRGYNTMQITFLERKPDGYWVQKSLDFSLLTLGYYLADDVGGRSSDIDSRIRY